MNWFWPPRATIRDNTVLNGNIEKGLFSTAHFEFWIFECRISYTGLVYHSKRGHSNWSHTFPQSSEAFELAYLAVGPDAAGVPPLALPRHVGLHADFHHVGRLGDEYR